MRFSRVAPRLYFGADPPTGTALRRLGFNFLVLTAAERQPPASYYPGVTVLHAPLDDTLTVPVKPAHAAAAAVERAWRAGRRIYVACALGYNRSGLVAALALWRITGKPGREVLRQVRASRPGALFNPAFARYVYHLR